MSSADAYEFMTLVVSRATLAQIQVVPGIPSAEWVERGMWEVAHWLGDENPVEGPLTLRQSKWVEDDEYRRGSLITLFNLWVEGRSETTLWLAAYHAVTFGYEYHWRSVGVTETVIKSLCQWSNVDEWGLWVKETVGYGPRCRYFDLVKTKEIDDVMLQFSFKSGPAKPGLVV